MLGDLPQDALGASACAACMNSSLTSTEMLKVLMSPSACSRSRSLEVMKSCTSGCVIEIVAIPAPRRVLWLTNPFAR